MGPLLPRRFRRAPPGDPAAHDLPGARAPGPGPVRAGGDPAAGGRVRTGRDHDTDHRAGEPGAGLGPRPRRPRGHVGAGGPRLDAPSRRRPRRRGRPPGRPRLRGGPDRLPEPRPGAARVRPALSPRISQYRQ
ncbi:hypothetical protein SGPA1_21508 [Streptomyces misionensis JCM 4497]